MLVVRQSPVSCSDRWGGARNLLIQLAEPFATSAPSGEVDGFRLPHVALAELHEFDHILVLTQDDLRGLSDFVDLKRLGNGNEPRMVGRRPVSSVLHLDGKTALIFVTGRRGAPDRLADADRVSLVDARFRRVGNHQLGLRRVPKLLRGAGATQP